MRGKQGNLWDIRGESLVTSACIPDARFEKRVHSALCWEVFHGCGLASRLGPRLPRTEAIPGRSHEHATSRAVGTPNDCQAPVFGQPVTGAVRCTLVRGFYCIVITMDVGVVDDHRFSNVPPRFRSRRQHARHAGRTRVGLRPLAVSHAAGTHRRRVMGCGERDDAAHHLSDGSLADWFDVLVHVRPGPSSP